MPHLLGRAIREAASALRDAGLEDAQREASILAAWALDTTTAALLAYPKRELSADQEARLCEAVRRRAAREPLAYITGRAEFFGLELEVDRRVIVPRPETEHVVEQALAIAREFDRPLIADIGAGSGCIALALARTLERAVIYAIDSSREALEVARANIRRHRLEHRVRLLHGDLLQAMREPVHIIASNPPYVATGEFDDLMPEIRDHEPRLALDGGDDGLAVIRRLIRDAPANLRAGGGLVMEIGANQGEAVVSLAGRFFSDPRIERDLAGLDRVLVARL